MLLAWAFLEGNQELKLEVNLEGDKAGGGQGWVLAV